MISIMACFITMKAVHCHPEKKNDSREKLFSISYESDCGICLIFSSLIYDIVHENHSCLNAQYNEVLTIFVLLMGYNVFCINFNLRAPPMTIISV